MDARCYLVLCLYKIKGAWQPILPYYLLYNSICYNFHKHIFIGAGYMYVYHMHAGPEEARKWN